MPRTYTRTAEPLTVTGNVDMVICPTCARLLKVTSGKQDFECPRCLQAIHVSTWFRPRTPRW